ncbi:hypothetical protein AAC387_Pa02g3257 [Persea americana]
MVEAGNVAAKESTPSSPQDFNPRSYQIEVYKAALTRNTIAVLETGAGKTMIAVMLMKEIGRLIKENGDKGLIIFLAPQVSLVNQQFKVIKDHTDFKVAEYYRDKGVENWTVECWEKEFSTQEVMVMTPQILLDALRNAFLTLDMVRLLIFDECHRASGKHPYTRIMKEFYHTSDHRPKVFGMTASPVVRKGVSSARDCQGQIGELESILDSKVCTVEDRNELEQSVPSAKDINRFYGAKLSLHEDLKAKLKLSLAKFNTLVGQLHELPQFKDTDDMIKRLKKRLLSQHEKILYCLDHLGLICAHEAAQIYVESNCGTLDGCDYSKESFMQWRYFLKEVLHTIEETLPHVDEKIWKVKSALSDAVKMGYISPKLYELLQIFQSFGESRQVHCLIFVERKITAKVIQRFMEKLNFLYPLTVSYLTGVSSSIDALKPKIQKNTLELFRCGEMNILLTTDVAEEGIDVHNCSCVIRFDLPKTVRSYIQSRGRARQNDSQYILMLERGNIEQRNQLFDIIRSERSMTNTALNRDPDISISKLCCKEDTNAYFVESTGATVTLDSSINLIKKYCEKLPGDKYYTPKPIFQFALHGGSYECTLTLPPNAAFQRIVGPMCRNSHLAKQHVCVDACKKLHQMGALDDHLLPSVEEPAENDLVEKSKGSPSGAGTTKRKELHGTTFVHALSGTWAHKSDGVTLWAYKMNFACNVAGENYSAFVLLVEAELDTDVASAEVRLHLVDKMVESSVSSRGQVHLNSDQVKKAKLFQEFFFNALFGKLFTGSRSSGVKRKFLLQTENQSLWTTMNMYLLLPLESSNSSRNETLNIDWNGVTACASVVDFFKNHSFVSPDSRSNGNEGSSSIDSGNSSKTGSDGLDIIHFANNSVQLHNLKNMVVVAIHTGRMYSVLDVTDKSTESPFDVDSDTAPAVYKSYSDYFNKKYGIVLKHPGQPLLLLKQSHNAHNLLSSKFNYEASGTKSVRTHEASGDRTAQKPRSNVHMPSELLVSIDVSINVLRSFYLLPSLMHRLESLMLASQLRKEIASSHSSCHISSLLILEALTTLRCCEDFSLERLELLGDSVLKYVVSCHLFLKFPQKHEGQLTTRRSWAVCNSTLHKLGTERKLQVSIHPVPCKCGVDTFEVPLQSTYETEETSIVIGKACDRGHRWMCSKTVADCVEALIGACYVGGGLVAALQVMRWLQIDAELDPQLVEKAIQNASLWCYVPKIYEIETLEAKLNYKFSVKGLLLEAITHPSQQEFGAGYCYQRLEFLGDSVLDLLITRHLFQSHLDIDPGELTDLRSANVNNENFAQVAVRNNLQPHLQHASGFLLGQITDYVKCLSEFNSNQNSLLSLGGSKGPKVLGDLVESISGAILVDTGLNVERVWEIYEPLLAPIVTPDKLELPPLRQLIELCDHLGYCISRKCTNTGEKVVAQLGVQLKDVLLLRQGCDRNRKSAKAQAALQLLNDLKERGYSHSRCVSKRKQCDQNSVDESSDMNVGISISVPLEENGFMGPVSYKRQKITEGVFHVAPSADPSFAEDRHHSKESSKASDGKTSLPVTLSINMEKGGPRTSLYDLCRRLQWPMPTFQSTEQKSRTPMVVGDGKKVFNSFVSKISLHIPNVAVIELTGEARADKKSSQDSAALIMLYELEKRGRCIIMS